MPQLLRYLVIGGISNLSIYCIYLLALQTGITPKISMTLCYTVGATIGFLGNKHWTFSNKSAYQRTVPRFLVAHISGYLLNLAILSILIDRLNFSAEIAQAIGIVIVAGFLFLAFKKFVFNHKNENRTPRI